MSTTDLTTDIRRQYGITVTLTTTPAGRTLEYSGEIRHSGGAVEAFGPVEGLAGRVQLLADLNYRASELVELAAMAHEDFAALPDATPTDAEAEAAQRELIEQERQAGVAETRPGPWTCDNCGGRYVGFKCPDCEPAWAPAPTAPADEAEIATNRANEAASSTPPCRRCGDTGQVEWPTLAGGTLFEDCPACRPAATPCADCATAVYSGDARCDDCADKRSRPVPEAEELWGTEYGPEARDRWLAAQGAIPHAAIKRPAPTRPLWDWGKETMGRGGVRETWAIDGRAPLGTYEAEAANRAAILARYICPACGQQDCNCAYVDEELTRSKTITNPQRDEAGAELAAALERETYYSGLALGDCTPDQAAQYERLAHAWRARADMLRQFGVDSALQALAAHVRANVRPVEADWLPFQERAA